MRGYKCLDGFSWWVLVLVVLLWEQDVAIFATKKAIGVSDGFLLWSGRHDSNMRSAALGGARTGSRRRRVLKGSPKNLRFLRLSPSCPKCGTRFRSCLLFCFGSKMSQFLQRKKPSVCPMAFSYGRGDMIRTCDLLLPKQAL